MKLLTFFVGFTIAIGSLGAKTMSAQEVNNELDGVSVFTGDFCIQARLTFTKPIKAFEHKVEHKGSVLKLVFPNTKLGEVNVPKLMQQLVDSGLVRNVALNFSAGTTTVSLAFEPDKTLIKIIKVKDSSRLWVHIWSKQELIRIKQSSDGPLFLAHAATHAIDTVPSVLKKKCPSVHIA